MEVLEQHPEFPSPRTTHNFFGSSGIVKKLALRLIVPKKIKGFTIYIIILKNIV